MDILKLAATATRIGMSLAGNAKEAVTLTLGRQGAYNPATDQMAGAGTQFPVLALPYKDKNAQKRQDISASSENLAIEAAQLPAGQLITERDTLTRTSGIWQITSAMLTAQALWILEIRR